MYNALGKWNAGRDYEDQIKPHNFMMLQLLSTELARGEFPPNGVFLADPNEWEEMEFPNIHDANSMGYRISPAFQTF